MSSTNKTTYYELPQFVENDIFNPLVDDNDAYDKIDTALHNIANAEADDAAEIVSIKNRLDGAEGDIDALETQNGSDVLTTVAQTLSGAVNELKSREDSLDGRLDNVEDDINNVSTGLKAKVTALETQNGSEVLTTTAQTLSGAINEVYSKLKNGFVTPEMFGAIGDGVTDDYDAIIAAINECFSSGSVLYFPEKEYYIASEIIIDDLNFDIIMNGKIIYSGTGTALTIIKAVHRNLQLNIEGTAEFNNTSIGVMFHRLNNSNIKIKRIANFSTGLYLFSQDASNSISYNQFTIEAILNFNYGILVDALSTGWVNENIFWGGRLSVETLSPYKANCTGIKFTSQYAYYHNNNIFYSTCLEGLHTAIDMDYGRSNTFNSVRLEGTTTGIIFGHGSLENILSFYETPTTVSIPNDARNFIRPIIVPENISPVFSTGDISSYSYNDANYGYAGEYLFAYEAGDVKSKIYHLEKHNGYVTGSLNLFVHIENINNIIGFTQHSNGSFRYYLKLYASDGSELTPTELGDNNFNFGYWTTVSGTNFWVAQSNVTADDMRMFYLPEAVHSIDIGIITNAQVYGFDVFQVDNYIHASFGFTKTIPYIKSNGLAKGCNTIPTCEGVKGDFVVNIGTNTSIIGWKFNGTTWDAVYNGTP